MNSNVYESIKKVKTIIIHTIADEAGMGMGMGMGNETYFLDREKKESSAPARFLSNTH